MITNTGKCWVAICMTGIQQMPTPTMLTHATLPNHTQSSSVASGQYNLYMSIVSTVESELKTAPSEDITAAMMDEAISPTAPVGNSLMTM